MSDDLHMAVRGHTVRAVVQAVDASGGEQMVAAQAHYGRPRSQIPVHYPFGFASYVPLDGAVTHLVAVGGDQADLVALPPSNPSAAGFGGLLQGESVLYDAVGQAVWLRGGKIVQVDAHTSLDVRVAGQMVLQATAEGVTVTGDLKVSGHVKADGDVVAGEVSLQDHVHGGVQSGSSATGKPEA